MARISGNPAVKGARGMVNGTLVYRKYQDGMILTGAPEKSSKAPSEKQLEHRKNFRLANFYAARVKADPELLAAYREAAAYREYPNVHSFIVADYFHSPEVISFMVDPQKEPSEVQRLAVHVIDLMFPRSVILRIQTPDGTELESGPAVMANDRQSWVLTLLDPTHLAVGNLLEVEVTDYPGHVVNASFVL